MADNGYRELRTDCGTAYGVNDLPERQLRQWLEDPDAWVLRHLDDPVKIGHDSLVVRAEIRLESGRLRVALKRYRPRSPWKAIGWWFRPSRARRAWHMTRLLQQRQVAVARPLAMAEPRAWPRPTSYLMTQWVEGAENLHLAAWRVASCPDRVRLRWAVQCAEGLGCLVGRMHACGIAHRDLKAANVLVAAADDRPVVCLVDSDGASPCRRLGFRRRVSNLARLAAGLEAHPWVGRSVCCRFLRAYVAQHAAVPLDWKQLWRAVARQAQRRVGRKRRSGEQVL